MNIGLTPKGDAMPSTIREWKRLVRRNHNEFTGLNTMSEEKKKHDVYKYKPEQGSVCFFSDGVKRDFGENKVIFSDGHQILARVQPLYGSGGLELVGYCYA